MQNALLFTVYVACTAYAGTQTVKSFAAFAFSVFADKYIRKVSDIEIDRPISARVVLAVFGCLFLYATNFFAMRALEMV